ncbi:putative virion core protein [Yokapox virus]|uniref:Putative virion core protein n=1 Tax=Yokapox virus TaxID=1076255 RepID=G3EIC3_9POXV|nr:putative virion core protein [Yokapox virus]AEN03634.1 putative virion core protein [Yokapox virus]
MELINIFLETDSGRVKLYIKEDECKNVSYAVKHFINILSDYIDIEQSEFYLVVKDKNIFYFKCDKGSVSIINNEYYVFDENLLFINDYDKVIGVEFVITESMPSRIFSKDGYCIVSVVSTHKFYNGLSI